MSRFNWEDFINERISVNCDTEEKALDFLAECEAQGIKWGSEDKATTYNYWDFSKEETTYSIYFGGIVVSDIEYDKNDDLKIVKWEI